MSRTIVQLRPDQVSALRELASRRGVSLSEIVRQGVDRILSENQRTERVERALALAGCASGPADLGERHDAYLEDVYGVTDAEREDRGQ